MPPARDADPADSLTRELARSEANLRTLIEHAQVGLLVHRFGPIAYVNPSLVSALGYRDAAELVGRHFWSIFHGNDLGGRFATRAPDPDPVIARLAGAGGQIFWAEVRGVIIEYDGAPAMLLLLRDLTGERRARATLREREGRIWSLFTESPVSLWEADFSLALGYVSDREAPLPDDVVDAALRKVRFIAINEATLELFEARTPDELLRAIPKLFGDSGRAMFRELFAAMAAKRTSFSSELPGKTLLGKPKHLSVRLNVLPGHEERWGRVVISMFDLTTRREQESAVQAALREKEVMLREINHRIKNNLQVISSLLSLQAQHVDDEATRTAFAESQSRVHAIALVHDQLYQSKNLAQVNIGEYLRQVVGNLARSADAAARNIRTDFKIEKVELAVDLAIPCGLLVNELASNAFVHAFVGRPDGGTLVVEVTRDPDQPRRVTVGVTDDGIGLPAAIDLERAKTLGLGLVMTFAEQLEAEVELRRDGGTAFAFTFDVPA